MKKKHLFIHLPPVLKNNSVKVNLCRFSLLVPDPSQRIGESVFVASLAEQGNFRKTRLDVRFSWTTWWMSLKLLNAKERVFACSPELLVGRNLSPGGQGFGPSVEASECLCKEKPLLQVFL